MHPASIFFENTPIQVVSGIRTTNGKLVGAVLAYSVCMSIGGASIICAVLSLHCHRKYCNKRLLYLASEKNLRSINQILHADPTALLKPVTTITFWLYDFQLPNTWLEENDIR